MKIIEIDSKNKEKWDDFVKSHKQGSFLESYKWGELQKKEGKKIWRFAIEKNDKYLGTMLLVKQDLPLGFSYLYSPMGPVMSLANLEIKIGKDLMAKTYSIAEQEKSIFLRLEPKTSSLAKIPLGFVKSFQVQPNNTQVLDISKSEEELLKEMHYKTRYNIRLAQRQGVKVSQSSGKDEDLEVFYKLTLETSKRAGISCHPKSHYREILEVLGPDMARLYLAKYEGKVVAAAIVIFFGNIATYVHGASSDELRNVQAPHLVQWLAILDAKKAGCRHYDFGGIAPEDASESHPWSGITKFKKGFGGYSESYMGSIDFPYRQGLYNLYLLRRKLRKS